MARYFSGSTVQWEKSIVEFQENLKFALNLRRVSAPLFVDRDSGLNDNLNGGQMGIHVLQLLGGDEAHLPVQMDLHLGEGPAQGVAGVAHRAYDGADGVLEEIHVPVGAGDDLLPVLGVERGHPHVERRAGPGL